MQDFPLRSAPIPHDSKASDFPATWTRILRSLNVAPALITMGKNGVSPPTLYFPDNSAYRSVASAQQSAHQPTRRFALQVGLFKGRGATYTIAGRQA